MRRIGPDVVFRRVVALVTGELFRWRGLVRLGNFTGVVWVRRALTEVPFVGRCLNCEARTWWVFLGGASPSS